MTDFDFDQVAPVAILSRIEGQVEALLELANRAGGDVLSAERINFKAEPDGPFDFDFRGRFHGFTIYNDQAFVVHVGIGSDTGTAARRLVTVGAGRFVTVPAASSVLSIGGGANPGSVAVVLYATPPDAGGGMIG